MIKYKPLFDDDLLEKLAEQFAQAFKKELIKYYKELIK